MSPSREGNSLSDRQYILRFVHVSISLPRSQQPMGSTLILINLVNYYNQVF